YEGAVAPVRRLADPARALRGSRRDAHAARRAGPRPELVLPLPRPVGGGPAGVDASRPEPRAARPLRLALVEDEHAVLLEDEPPGGVLAQPDECRRRGERRDPVGVARAGLVRDHA